MNHFNIKSLVTREWTIFTSSAMIAEEANMFESEIHCYHPKTKNKIKKQTPPQNKTKQTITKKPSLINGNNLQGLST